jgi:ribonuclease P protein subunit RPR2
MAKAKDKKGSSGGVNSHLRARLAYLHNAASLLQSVAISSKKPDDQQADNGNRETTGSTKIVPHVVKPGIAAQEQSFATGPSNETHRLSQLARVYVSHLRGVSLKSQLRLPVEVKRSFCKRCDTLLTPNVNCTQEIRNESCGRKKPWADVLVIRCTTCETEKRFPQTEKRSKKLAERRKEKAQAEKSDVK